MDKLNVFEGKLDYLPRTENRLTWAILSLIRLSPIVCMGHLLLSGWKKTLSSRSG